MRFGEKVRSFISKNPLDRLIDSLVNTKLISASYCAFKYSQDTPPKAEALINAPRVPRFILTNLLLPKLLSRLGPLEKRAFMAVPKAAIYEYNDTMLG